MTAVGFRRIGLCGSFRIEDGQGRDLTPRGRKECAIVAALALSGGYRRPRLWLQDLLWSDRAPEQGRVSLRRALANLRKPLGRVLGSDRNEVWLAGAFEVETSDDDRDLLDGLHIRDPAFTRWRKTMRERAAGGARILDQPERLFAILLQEAGKGCEERFLLAHLCGVLARRLNAFGDVDVADFGSGAGRDEAQLLFEVESLLWQGYWLIHLRCLSRRRETLLWAGDLRLPLDYDRILAGSELDAFLDRSMTVIEERCLRRPVAAATAYFQISQAMRQLYTGRQGDAHGADALLSRIGSGAAQGVALALRSYVRLIDRLEFRDPDARIDHQALDLATEAMAAAPHHPTALGLVAQVQMKVIGDLDHGRWLAQRAHVRDERNPFALHALSQARQMAGQTEAALDAAIMARRVAQGGPLGFCWDMQAALAALGLGRLQDALTLALDAHAGNPAYRPALRYLVALSAILVRQQEAMRFAARLARFEPDFHPGMLLDPAYPMHTLRQLGLDGALGEALARITRGEGPPRSARGASVDRRRD